MADPANRDAVLQFGVPLKLEIRLSKLKPKQSWKPFYFGDPKWKKILLMPASALKIWFCHYGHENQEDESWPSIETLMEETGLSRDSVFTYRKWLLDHGWIVNKGFAASRHGHFSVPKYSVRRGTVSEKTVDGRIGNLPTRSHRKRSDSDASEKIGAEVDSSLNKQKDELNTPDQSSNQSTQAAPAAFFGDDENQNPSESGVAPARKTPTQEELETYFPRCPVTPGNLTMLEEINAALGDAELEDLLRWNYEHQQGKLRLHSLAQTHRAVVHGSPENGILTQFKYHTADDCRTCVRKKKEREKNAPPTTSLHPKFPGQSIPRPKFSPDDLWGFKPSGDGGWNRCLQHKPRTSAKRLSLIGMQGQPGIRWEYLAGFLAQDKCPKCLGKGVLMEPTKFAGSKKFVECTCVLMEEML